MDRHSFSILTFFLGKFIYFIKPEIKTLIKVFRKEPFIYIYAKKKSNNLLLFNMTKPYVFKK